MPQKAYFFSDAHLGLDAKVSSKEREKRLVKQLKTAAQDASVIYLLGDMFDIWYEYKYAVPKGYVRLLGTLAELCDAGLEIHYFTGNHDMWITDYLSKEIGLRVSEVHRHENIFGTHFYIGHGHGIGKADAKYARALKYIFRNPVLRFAYDWLHPDIGLWLANKLSRQKRYLEGFTADPYYGDDKEFSAQFVTEVKELPEFKDTRYFVFGHRHILVNKPITEDKTLVVLGNWIDEFSYGVFDGEQFTLERYHD